MKHERTRRSFPAKLLLLFALILLSVLSVLYLRHQRMLRKEARFLQSRGYRYAAADGDYTLSYLESGNDAGKHRIVAISGLGVSDYSVQLRTLAAGLGEDSLLVCIDRAGYGLSGDTDTPQTVQQIVNDYRAALKNANIEPPYILLPHAEGGVYATFWESMYPEETEGVFFLDGTFLSDVPPEAPAAAGCGKAAACLGIQRLEKYTLPAGYNATEQLSARMLRTRSAATSAQASERKLFPENCRTAYSHIAQNAVPKAYLRASSYRTAAEWLAADDWARTFRRMQEVSDAERQQYSEQHAAQYQQLTELAESYAAMLGNCEYFELPGDSFIHMQKPTQCSVLFSRFLTRIENDNHSSQQ